jgi:hypothetical protein
MEMQEREMGTPPSKSIEECSHSHPYEYLTKLNQVFNGYNKSTVRDYSSASKIKLPFYKFSSMKVPSCFEDSYTKEHRELVNYNSVEVSKMDDGDRKLWKEHEEIIRSYLAHKKTDSFRPHKKKGKEVVAEKAPSRVRHNVFIKKLIEKGSPEYDPQKLEQEVL